MLFYRYYFNTGKWTNTHVFVKVFLILQQRRYANMSVLDDAHACNIVIVKQTSFLLIQHHKYLYSVHIVNLTKNVFKVCKNCVKYIKIRVGIVFCEFKIKSKVAL